MNKQWSVEDEKQLKQDYSNLELLPEYISAKYGTTWEAIKVKARSLGYKRGHAKIVRSVLHNLPMDTVKQLYQQGLSCRAIAKQLKCSFPTISAALKKAGLTVKGNIEMIKVHSMDENYFENIDTSEKAYWLGWLAADGGMYEPQWSISSAIHKDDIELLENFKKALKASHPVETRMMPSNGKIYERATIYIQSKKMCQDLIKHGVGPKKSLTLEFPDISEKFHAAFMLGYVDGDGSVFQCENGQHGFNITSSPGFCKKYQEILIKNCQLEENKLDDYHDKTWKVAYKGLSNLKKIYDFLYQDNLPCLTRKKQRFLEYLSQA